MAANHTEGVRGQGVAALTMKRVDRSADLV